MAFNGYRWKAMQDRDMIAKLAQGEKPKQIAVELKCSYSTLRRRLSRHVHATGCQTVEEAVAKHVAETIKRSLPLAFHNQVDLMFRKK